MVTCLVMIRLLVFLTFSLFTFRVCGQETMQQYLMQVYLPQVELEDYASFNFKWDLPGNMQALINDGLTNLDEEKYNKAIQAFDDAIQTMPTFAPAFYYRGICHKKISNFDKARLDLNEAARLAPKEPCVLTELGEVYQTQGRFTEAQKIFRKAIKLNPDIAEPYYALGNIEYQTKNNKTAAMEWYEKSNAITPFPKALVRMAVHTYSDNPIDQKIAIDYLTKALHVDSSFQRALFWKALLQSRMGLFSESLKDLNKLIRYNPTNAGLIVNRATLYTELGDYDRAFIDFKELSRSLSGIDRNLFTASQSLLDKQLDYQFAFQYVTRTMFGLSESAMTLLKKGFCFLAVGKNYRAINQFSQSLTIERSAVSYFLIALAQEHIGEHDSAFNNYQRALKIDKDIFDAHKKVAIYFSVASNFRKAYEHFEHMVRLEPSLPVTYRLRSQIRLQFKDYYGTMLDLNKFIAKDTTNAEVYAMRGFSLYSLGNYREAKPDLERAIRLDSTKSSNYNLLVETLLHLKDTAQAFACILTCERRMQLDPSLFIVKIRLLIEAKNIEKASKLIESVMGTVKLINFSHADMVSLYVLDSKVDYARNHLKSALKKVNNALEITPKNDEGLFLRAKILIKQGENEQARKDLLMLTEKGYAGSKELLSAITY
jgi:tetratricopeptide (TPR) repeat protein